MSSEIIQQQIDSIESQVALAEKGYQAFRRMYAQTNRPPERRVYKSRLGLLRVAVVIVMVAGSIVSANHTIPTFMGSGSTLIVGIAAFFMSELALAAFAYIGVMRHYRETQQEPKSLKTLVSLGVIVPFVVMAAANINHEFELQKIDLPDFIAGLITLAISLSAPFMSYISGEVFAMFEVIDRVDQEKHDADYALKVDGWEDKCRAAWGREKGNYGGKIKIEAVPVAALPLSQVSDPSVLSVSVQTDKTDIRQTGAGNTRVSTAVEIARQWLTDNPDKAGLPLRQLEDMIGVGKDSISKARKDIGG